MRLLLFSDIHVNESHCHNLVSMANNADIVIGAGDFGSLRRDIGKTISWLKDIKKPAVLVPGNAESYEELKEACRVWPSAVVLHGNGAKIMNVRFYGLGGGVPVTPFGPWSYDFTEEEAADLLKDCPAGSVLISHSPPKGILDRSSRGQNLGSEAVRQLIERQSPILVVCGHIHESSGKTDKLGNTTIVNAGPLGMFFELSNT